jgi:hypothetical protein
MRLTCKQRTMYGRKQTITDDFNRQVVITTTVTYLAQLINVHVVVPY